MPRSGQGAAAGSGPEPEPLRVLRVPAAATRLVLGPVLADYLQADAVFSNIRLRGLGFHFRYPTLEQGLQEVLGALDE